MAERDRPHILFRDPAQAEPYRPHGKAIKAKSPPSPRDRVAHGTGLKTSLETAAATAHERREAAAITVRGAQPGVYVVFESQPGFDLKLESLDSADPRKGIELVTVTRVRDVQRATVFVPDGKVKHFLERFEEYTSKQTPKGEPKHKPLVESIAAVRLATLRALWTDEPSAYPTIDQAMWWEVWLRRHDGDEVRRLTEFAAAKNLTIGPRQLAFPTGSSCSCTARRRT
jgi:hypothetical protein